MEQEFQQPTFGQKIGAALALVAVTAVIVVTVALVASVLPERSVDAQDSQPTPSACDVVQSMPLTANARMERLKSTAAVIACGGGQ